MQSADREAISHFAYEAIQGSDPISRVQATIGAIGLAAKSAAETITGQVLYGKHAKNKTPWSSSQRTAKLG